MLLQTLFTFLISFSHAGPTKFLPQGDCHQKIQQAYYTICYSDKHRQAKWTIHRLTLNSINGKQKRTNDFRKNPQVDDPVGSKDFSGSGFDRGHMVPAADMKLNKQAMSETFYMSNMSPQNSSLNRGMWGSLERRTRDWVKRDGEAYVVTAPVLENGLNRIKSGVSIPDYYYKIIYFPDDQIVKAFLIPNIKPIKNEKFYDYSVSVDEIEKVTGLDFFAELPDSIEDELEATSYYY
jgi:endonuclease G